jgi:hypothetical protein
MHDLLAQLTTSQPAEQARAWFETIKGFVLLVPVRVWIWIGCGLACWFVLRRAFSGVARAIRRRRPVRIHPSLQKYNVDRVELQKRQRELAAGVVATSTSNRLAGYRLLRQVEAVFVEGFSSPEDALVALKAAAVERGGNAILNVKTEHTAAGRCTASGDAVFVATIVSAAPRPSSASPPVQPPGPD